MILSAQYDGWLVTLSFIISVLASYTALDLMRHMRYAEKSNWLYWLIGGAIAMGTGIWSMHFVAMLAYQLPIPIRYNVPIVGLSLFVAIIGGSIALFLAGQPQFKISTWLSGGTLMGLTIAAMHYIGMMAVQVNATMHYKSFWVILSIIIAIGASLTALIIDYQLSVQKNLSGNHWKFASAVIMGIAISAMHYTGMVAVYFIVTNTPLINSANTVDNTLLATAISIATMVILGLALLTSLFDQKLITQKEYSTELEKKVKERTSDLKNAFEHVNQLNQKLQDELRMAQQIQKSLLPPAKPMWRYVNTICYSMPAHEVGGDWYAYLPTGLEHKSKKQYHIAIGDISGKGMPAALLMAVSLTLFQSTHFQYDIQPSDLMASLDKAIAPYTKSTRNNCAMCYIQIEALAETNNETFSLKAVNAGGIPPYIKRANGSVEWHEVGGFALGQGLGSKFGYREYKTHLSKGDMVILTSDGVAEANANTDDIFGFERVYQTIKTAPNTSVEATLEHIKQAIMLFIGNADPHDDLTIVVIKV